MVKRKGKSSFKAYAAIAKIIVLKIKFGTLDFRLKTFLLKPI